MLLLMIWKSRQRQNWGFLGSVAYPSNPYATICLLFNFGQSSKLLLVAIFNIQITISAESCCIVVLVLTILISFLLVSSTINCIFIKPHTSCLEGSYENKKADIFARIFVFLNELIRNYQTYYQFEYDKNNCGNWESDVAIHDDIS